MNEYPPIEELYLGCECMDLDHVAQFIHFPPTENGSKRVMEDDSDEPCIYLNVSTNNYYQSFFPSIRYLFDKYSWQSFFAYNWYKRLWIAGRYIFNISTRQKWGVFDAFDFQNKDLKKLDAFMALISSDIDAIISNKFELCIYEDWSIVIAPTRLEFEEEDYKGPWQVGWEIQFLKRKFWGRIRYAMKYIFGSAYQKKQFMINEKDAAQIRSMIKWVRETNKEKPSDG